jgi:hypothetical protein
MTPSLAAGEQRLLAAMPLHAITAMYGENGLRERLAHETSIFADTSRHGIGRALELSTRLHAGDRRQREPYINHPLRVAIRIICHYHVHDPEIVCAALLHDAVEDHSEALAPGGGTPAALSVLAAEFGPRVADLVAAVTNPDYTLGRDVHDQYLQHVTASLKHNPWARVIKLSDFTDNGVGLIHTSGPMLCRLAGKYAPLVTVLRGLIARPDTPLGEGVKAKILGQLDQAEVRFAAILPTQDPVVATTVHSRPSS